MSPLHRRRFLYLLGGTAAGAGIFSFRSRMNSEGDDREGHFRSRTFQLSGFALGSPVSLTVMHADSTSAELAMAAGFAELELVEEVMSLYRPHSQLSQLNKFGSISDCHPYLHAVFTAARDMSERTNGAFDITVQPLWKLYADAKANGSQPAEQDIVRTRRLVDWRGLQFDRATARFAKPGMSATLNGIAQGFAADRVAAVLREHGVEHALIDTGELEAMGAKPDRGGWNVGIQHPRLKGELLCLTKLAGRCLATSGDYATWFSADFGDHHIFDPRTGRSPVELASVSVVAESAMQADALSTAVFVLGPDAGIKLIQDTANADALLVLKDGQTRVTAGFPVA